MMRSNGAIGPFGFASARRTFDGADDPVELGLGSLEEDRELLLAADAQARFTDRVAELSGPAPGVVEVSLVRDDAVDVQRVPAPPRRPWPFVRRLLSEGRDRARPLVGRRARASARS